MAGRQPHLFLWPKDLIKPDLQINLIVNEQVGSDLDNMNRLQARRDRVEQRKRESKESESNDWDERMTREEMLARRITQLLQRVDVPQVGRLLEEIMSKSSNGFRSPLTWGKRTRMRLCLM